MRVLLFFVSWFECCLQKSIHSYTFLVVNYSSIQLFKCIVWALKYRTGFGYNSFFGGAGTPGNAQGWIQELLLRVLGRPHEMPEIESELIVCKINVNNCTITVTISSNSCTSIWTWAGPKVSSKFQWLT